MQKSDLRLDRREDALRGGESGVAAIVPGDSKGSLLMRYVTGADPKLVMPPAGPRLTGEEIAVLRQWIDAGAQWSGAETSRTAEKKDARLGHWAFQPLGAAPAIPVVRDRGWVRNPIDAFVLAKLEARGWRPAARAGQGDLLRRMYLDVIGLPPTVEEQERFGGTGWAWRGSCWGGRSMGSGGRGIGWMWCAMGTRTAMSGTGSNRRCGSIAIM
ncbi:MAG: c-type cytochrome domain-containing protein [bacterium]